MTLASAFLALIALLSLTTTSIGSQIGQHGERDAACGPSELNVRAGLPRRRL
jgi:hypothetical protein